MTPAHLRGLVREWPRMRNAMFTGSEGFSLSYLCAVSIQYRRPSHRPWVAEDHLLLFIYLGEISAVYWWRLPDNTHNRCLGTPMLERIKEYTCPACGATRQPLTYVTTISLGPRNTLQAFSETICSPTSRARSRFLPSAARLLVVFGHPGVVSKGSVGL